MHAVGTRQVVLLDDISPRLVAAAVSQIEVDDVVVLQGFLHLPRLLQVTLAGTAPCAPDVKIDDTSLIGLDNLAQDGLAVAHTLHVG